MATGATFFLDSESQLQAAVRGFDAAPGAMPPAGAGPELDITFRPQPDPPRAGDTALEVSVKDAAGAPGHRCRRLGHVLHGGDAER